MSDSTPRLLIDALSLAVIVILIVFGVAFSYLIYNAFSFADTNIGLTMSFTGYLWISIEASFLFLMAYGGYYVLRSGGRRPTIEVEMQD